MKTKENLVIKISKNNKLSNIRKSLKNKIFKERKDIFYFNELFFIFHKIDSHEYDFKIFKRLNKVDISI